MSDPPNRPRRWVIVVGSAVVVAAGAAVFVRWQRTDTTFRAPIGPETVVMMGDSITEGGNWQSLLEGLEVANQGYSGFTTAQLVPVAEEVAGSRPAVVFILTGTNDIRDGHRPTWTVRNLDQILGHFERLAPRTEVVVQTVLPRRDAPDRVEALNGAIQDLVSERGLRLLDLHPAFDDGSGGLRPNETSDGVHLTEAGYRVWARLIEEELRSIRS